MADYEIKVIPRQDTAAIRLSCPMDAIGESMSDAFPRVFHAIGRAGLAPAGMPLARYFEFGGPVIEFECAIPVAAPFAADGDVQPSEVGGGDAATATHTGPYDTIGETWEALVEWVGGQGRAPGGPTWESYQTDPSDEPDPAKWVTQLYVPLA